MELLASFGKRSEEGDVYVGVVSESEIRVGAKVFDLRAGKEVRSLRTIDIVYGRDGRVLRNKRGVLSVVHRHGRDVPLALEDIGVNQPVFVGSSSLVVQDDRTKKKPFGVFDTETGALRGRMNPAPEASAGEIYAPSLYDPNDGRHLWMTAKTSLVCWDVERVEVTKTLPLPAGFRCEHLTMTESGHLVTHLTPERAKGEPSLVVLSKDGKEIARRPQKSVVFARAGGQVVVFDHDARELLFFDETLTPLGSIRSAHGDDALHLIELWSGATELLAVDDHQQVHHYGTTKRAKPKTPAPPAKPKSKTKAKTKAKAPARRASSR